MKRQVRKIITIDENLCDGCGDCVDACAEGAIKLVDGKARLVSDVYCDGLGACIGECPRGAITIVEREAEAFDEAAVAAAHHGAAHGGSGCPGSAPALLTQVRARKPQAQGDDQPPPSLLGHWPVQLMLVPPQAPFLRQADIVVCADCIPFTVPDFHARYLDGRAVLVGCPKLDDLGFYAEKLAEIFRRAEPSRVTVVRMEVPCCSGLSRVTVEAALQEGLSFPVEDHVAGVRGGIMRRVLRA